MSILRATKFLLAGDTTQSHQAISRRYSSSGGLSHVVWPTIKIHSYGTGLIKLVLILPIHVLLQDLLKRNCQFLLEPFAF